MKLFQNIRLGFLLTFFFSCYSCQSKTEKVNEELGKENATQDKETTKQIFNAPDDQNEPEPITCMDWIGYYGKTTRELDSVVNKNVIKVKGEGYDKYNSANSLEGVYVLKDKNMSTDRIGNFSQIFSLQTLPV
jgi:hypothetical protein